MPAGNSTTAASSIGTAAISSLASNSPLQTVPCSPFILRGSAIPSYQQSPAAMVPNVRRISQTPTPDTGLRHLVPKTPTPRSDFEVPQVSSNWSMPMNRMKAPEPTSGEQLVPQSPYSSTTYNTPIRPRHHIQSADDADTPRRNIQRKPRQLPPESPQHPQDTSQIDLFSGGDIFG